MDLNKEMMFWIGQFDEYIQILNISVSERKILKTTVDGIRKTAYNRGFNDAQKVK